MNPIFDIWRKSVTHAPRQDKTRHDTAWQGKARPDEASRGSAQTKRGLLVRENSVKYLSQPAEKVVGSTITFIQSCSALEIMPITIRPVMIEIIVQFSGR